MCSRDLYKYSVAGRDRLAFCLPCIKLIDVSLAPNIMCDYTQIEFRCGHVRYTVRSWCTIYETTHKRCPPNVVAVEFRLDERCGDCRTPAIYPSWVYQVSVSKHTRGIHA
ncbi:hypothetical protein F5884DRAFT_147560 [Xylogone sp. PMI_703]|nr:hypothetical protein F5884DRAFT_147560 [Xylogone sp. PMI_703]